LWLAGPAAVLAVAACTTAAAPKTAVRVSGAEVMAAGAAAGPFPATFIAISTGYTGYRLAVYSAANGRLLRYLTAAEPGGGAGGPGLEGAGVFTDNDRQVSASGSQAGVLRVPSLTGRAYATAPRGCRYVSLAGTSTELFATPDCGARDALSVVALSPRTFTATRTLIRLGTCLYGSISAAVHDPSALLAETEGACLPPTAVPKEQILEIRGAEATMVLSGSASFMPMSAIW
jgi:hypothetical protein